MVSLLRKYQKITMALFAIVSCFALIGFFNGPTSCSRDRMPVQPDVFGKIYGNPISKSSLQREARKAVLAAQLQLPLLNGLAGRATTENEAENNFAWNSVVLQHEADQLQIEPMGDAVHTDESVTEAIKNLPKFQTSDGQFDPTKYADFVANFLPSLGFGAGDLEEVVAEDLRMKKIKDLLKTTFVVPPAEFEAAYTRNYQKLDVSVIHFNLADFTAKIQVSDDDIKKAFEQHLEGYKSEEKRGIKFATFSLSDDEQKLTGKDRIAALQKLANSVQDFMQALQENGAKFDDVTAKFKTPVTDVPPFTQSSPDPKIPTIPGFLEMVGQLSTQTPDSEPLRDPETGAYYVAHLQEIVPSRLLTLAEARPQIIDQVKNSRAQEELAVEGSAARNKILADIAAGKSFADAAKAEGLKIDAYPPFSYNEPDELEKKDDGREVMFSSLEMKEGDLGEFVPTEAGGILVHMDKREPIDQKQFETDRARLEPQFDEERVDIVFSEWMRKQHDVANIIIGTGAAAAPTPIPPPK